MVTIKLEQCGVKVLVSVYDYPATAVNGEAILLNTNVTGHHSHKPE